MLITEKELSGLVISDGVDKLTMANNATCGFVTESGRKGFAKHLYKNPSRVFLTKIQIGNRVTGKETEAPAYLDKEISNK